MILGSEKSIHIWVDNVMGNRPLEKKFDLLPLKNWMDGQNFKTLYDILEWSKSIGYGWDGQLVIPQHIFSN